MGDLFPPCNPLPGNGGPSPYDPSRRWSIWVLRLRSVGRLTPTTAPAAEGIWSRLLVCVDVVLDSEEPAPHRQRRLKVTSPKTAATTEEEPSFLSWNRSRTFASPQPPDLSWDVNPASSSSWSLRNPPSLSLPIYRVSEILWMRIHLHLC